MFELKNCPFCGAKARLYVQEGVRVVCTLCDAQTRSVTDNIGTSKFCAVEIVIDAWNRRKEDEAECVNYGLNVDGFQ